jgi:glycosyltransferase involved in cell wall biosynthesis
MDTIIIAHNYQDASFSSMSFHLANHLCLTGMRVVFISKSPYFTSPIREKIGNGELILTSWPSKIKSTSFKDFKFIYKILKEFRPRVVIGHHNGSIASIILSKLIGHGKIKTFEYHHVCSESYIRDKGEITFRLKFFLFRKKLFYHLFCNHVVCPSEFAIADLNHNFNYKKGEIVINPLPDRAIDLKTKELNGEIIIGYLGRLVPTKNVLELASEFIKFKSSGPKNNIKLKIVGYGEDESKLKSLIFDVEYIEFIGELDYNQIDSFIKNCHFTIIPSLADNLPTAATESIMNGIPILISKGVGTASILKHKTDAYIFDLKNNGLQNTFKYVNEISQNDYDDLCEISRKTYQKYFLMEAYLKKMKALIA